MIGIIKKIANKKNGFTLIEIIITVSIFSVIMVVAIDSFIKVIQVNRQSIQAQDMQNNIRFLYELMSKEIKMAQKGDGGCNSFFRNHIDAYGGDYRLNHASRVYSTTIDNNGNSVLFLKNYHNQCTIYYIDNNRLKIKRAGIGEAYVLPQEITVNKFSIDVVGDFKSIRHTPYSVIMYMNLKNIEWSPDKIGIQTAISARYIE